MTKEQAEAIQKQAEVWDYEIEIRDDYSGRGMFGKKTYAVTGNQYEIQECIDDAEECYQVKFHWDSMGKYGSVCY